jgi:hypothetical protein
MHDPPYAWMLLAPPTVESIAVQISMHGVFSSTARFANKARMCAVIRAPLRWNETAGVVGLVGRVVARGGPGCTDRRDCRVAPHAMPGFTTISDKQSPLGRQPQASYRGPREARCCARFPERSRSSTCSARVVSETARTTAARVAATRISIALPFLATAIAGRDLSGREWLASRLRLPARTTDDLAVALRHPVALLCAGCGPPLHTTPHRIACLRRAVARASWRRTC